MFYSLHIDFDVLHQIIAIEIENEIVHEVESIADDNQRELIGQFGFLEEVLHSLGIVAVRFAANTFDFFDLTRLACGLDVFEVNIRLLTEVDDRAKKVEETWQRRRKSVMRDDRVKKMS